MLRWFFKKFLLCIAILGIFYYLNEKNPQWIQNIGQKIGGEVGNRVSIAVDRILDRAEERSGLSDFVEVFREERDD